MAMRFVSTPQIILMFCIMIGIFEAQPAQAQLFFSRIPPADVVSIVRNRGFYDVSPPYFRGDVYVVDATERKGLRVRLIVEPRSGEIVERLIIGRNNRVYPSGPNIWKSHWVLNALFAIGAILNAMKQMMSVRPLALWILKSHARAFGKYRQKNGV
jgi:hypothetical protein